MFLKNNIRESKFYLKIAGLAVQRPISPHIQIYRPQITSVMSILHRITGVITVVALVLISVLFISSSYGEAAFNSTVRIVFSLPGKIILCGFLLGISYHLCNGIRHLFWDAGYGLRIDAIRKSAVFVIVGAVMLSFFFAI